jgi:hypothetical protein
MVMVGTGTVACETPNNTRPARLEQQDQELILTVDLLLATVHLLIQQFLLLPCCFLHFSNSFLCRRAIDSTVE